MICGRQNRRIWDSAYSYKQYIQKQKQHALKITTHLRTKIGDRNSSKNKSSNDVIRGRPAFDVCWNKSLMSWKFNVKFEYLWIPKNLYLSSIPSVLLWNKVTETNALPVPEWNYKFIPELDFSSEELYKLLVLRL